MASPRTIGAVMSPAKITVTPSDSLLTAKELMQANAIRHLPVLEKGRVIGMVTLGDLFAMEAVVAADPETTEVSEAMSRDVYCVPSMTPLVEVAGEMAKRHIGSVVVVDGGRVAGVFTSTDACRVLAELLSEMPSTS